MDSTVLAYKLLTEGHAVKAISFAYGQKHTRELKSASSLAVELRTEHHVADLTSLTTFFGDNALTNTIRKVPLGHYAAESMKSTIVPNRNMIFLS